MSNRAADDFVTIGAKYKELTAVPVPKRSGSGGAGLHCAHCPTDPAEHCALSCATEGEKAGVVQ
jgi:hypothetical protein